MKSSKSGGSCSVASIDACRLYTLNMPYRYGGWDLLIKGANSIQLLFWKVTFIDVGVHIDTRQDVANLWAHIATRGMGVLTRHIIPLCVVLKDARVKFSD